MNPTFPDYDMEPMEPAPAVEAQLVGYALRDLSALDHVGSMKLWPYHFGDDRLRSIYSRLLSCRQAGDSEVDTAVVAAELPEVVSPAELARIEMQAGDMTPGRVESLASRVIEGWQAREVRRKLAALAFEDSPPANVIEAARRQLDRIEAAAPGRATGDAHPLAQFVKLRKTTQAVRWAVPGVIEHGVVTIAGARGVGKTTSILPLALSAAGLHEPGYPLAPHPDRWRHVIYAVEQVEQAERILAGLVECSGMGITWEQVEERFHLVPATRLRAEAVVRVAGTYREQFARMVDGVEILPLVVFDTQSASFEMDNESDNAEAGRIMAALRQRFEQIPIWILGHVAKTSIGRSDVQALTARGAGAFEGDSIANFYLVEEHGQRFLSIGKHRAEPRFGKELLIESGEQIVTGYNEWEEPEDVHLRWSIVRPMDQTRAEMREQSEAAAERDRKGGMRDSIKNAVQVAWQSGNPLSRNGVVSRVTGKTADIKREIESLLTEGWLHEVPVPASIRRVPSKSVFLICLDTPEHDAKTVPAAKLTIPESWKKSAFQLVPEVEAENGENDEKPAAR
jgi:hypothetical protein